MPHDRLFEGKGDFFENIKSFTELIAKVGLKNLESYYYNSLLHIPLPTLVEMINRNDDNWGLMKSNGQMSETDEEHLTDFTTLIHSLFEASYSEVEVDELLKSFIPVD